MSCDAKLTQSKTPKSPSIPPAIPTNQSAPPDPDCPESISRSQHFLEPFHSRLARDGVELKRGRTRTLQVNVGLRCNQTCRHCHLEAGPDREETMTPETMAEVALFCRRGDFDTVDITGGAPELNPHVGYLIQRLAGEVPRIMLRSNLTALAAEDGGDLLDIFMTHKVALVASLPATNKSETDSIRGRGVWEESIQALRMLNNLGYGVEGTGLELDIAVNPAGAFLKPKQCAEERRFKSELKAQFGVVFNSLFALANSPLGRFRRWLEESGIFDEYLTRLAAGFNPCAVQGLMCRSTVSISWDGRLFDCDFNQAEKKYLSGSPVHVSQADSWPAPGTPIATGVHCYACTAGEGFTCGGAIEGR